MRTMPETDATRDALATYMPEVHDDRRLEELAGRLREPLAELAAQPCAPELRALPAVIDDDPNFARWTLDLVASWVDETNVLTPTLLGPDVVADPGRLKGDAVATAAEAVGPIPLRALLALLHQRRSDGLLTGETPEERFVDFRRWLAGAAGAAELFRGFGASLGTARRRVTDHVRHLAEVVAHWEADRELAASVLPGLSAGARISRLRPGSGDTHHHGRSVTLVELDDGRRVVHKPRSLAADAGFARIVGELETELATGLRAVRVLDRDDHGWAEFVVRGQAPADPRGHRTRLGRLTGLLHLLGATDIHFENVVTDTEGRPVLVDCETLLSPLAPQRPSYDDGAASRIARRTVKDSVLGIGTLPMAVSVPGRATSLDIGVAGSISVGSEQLFGSLVVHDVGRDDMHVRLERRLMTEGNANPGLDPTDLEDVHDFRDSVRRGVVDVLSWAARDPERVAALVERELGAARQRFVHLPTIFYAQLLRMQTHPAVLADPVSRHAVLGRVLLKEGGDERPLGRHEMAQMARGDVPLFSFLPRERHLRDDGGEIVERDFFTRPPIDAVRRRLETLTEAEIARQADLVDLAFVPSMPDGGERTGLSWEAGATGAGWSTGLDGRSPEPGARVPTAAAHLVLDRWICGTDPAHPATFYGPVVTTSDAAQWIPGVLGYDLYGGTAGIALGLTVSGAADVVPAGWQRVDAILGPMTAQLVEGRLDAHELSPGGMTGVGGTAWALGACAAHRGVPLDRAALVRALSVHVPDEGPAEFVTGSAGALAAAVSLARGLAVLDPATAAALRRIAAPVLTAAAHVRSTGTLPGATHAAFTGMAHGVAGLVAPLAAVSSALGDPRPAERAADLVDLLVECRTRHGRWPRQLDGSDTSHAWCHGEPGILLALGLARAEGIDVPAEVLAALEADTREQALGHNPSLCHGDLGSLDCLLESARAGGDEAQAARAAALLGDAARRHLRIPRREARDRYHHTDSLMVGTAGALYALARATDPTVPCVLALR